MQMDCSVTAWIQGAGQRATHVSFSLSVNAMATLKVLWSSVEAQNWRETAVGSGRE